MTIYEIAFYRRVMAGWEFTSNRLFSDRFRALKLLRLMGYRLIEGEEVIFYKQDSRATLLERTVEQ